MNMLCAQQYVDETQCMLPTIVHFDLRIGLFTVGVG